MHVCSNENPKRKMIQSIQPTGSKVLLDYFIALCNLCHTKSPNLKNSKCWIDRKIFERLSCMNGDFFNFNVFSIKSLLFRKCEIIIRWNACYIIKYLARCMHEKRLYKWYSDIQAHTNTCNAFAKQNRYITNNIKTFSTISEQRFKWNSVAQIAEIPNKNTTHISEVMKSKKQSKEYQCRLQSGVEKNVALQN